MIYLTGDTHGDFRRVALFCDKVKSTEEWLDKIEDKLSYSQWYCGHYHTDKTIDNLRFLFEDFMEFRE